MATVWWCIGSVMSTLFLKSVVTITAEKYCTQVDTMHQKLRIVLPILVNKNELFLLHDNARTHVFRTTVQKLLSLHHETPSHSSYSELSTTDYHFLKHLGHFLVGKRYNSKTAVKSTAERFLRLRTLDFDVAGINDLVSRRKGFVASNATYFDY